MKVIGLDVGEKRIGVARADSETKIAVPVGFINVDGTEWQQIIRIAEANSTNLFVLGLPRSNDGNETAQSQYVRNFANTLASQMPNSDIRFQDESLTSVMAFLGETIVDFSLSTSAIRLMLAVDIII